MTTTVLNTKISEVDNKIPDTSSWVTTTVLNTKISEVESKIPNHDKYTTTPAFNKLTAENYASRLKQTNLVSKSGFYNKQTNFKVARVVNIKLGFTDQLFCNLIMLIKWWKFQYLNLDEALVFLRNHAIYLKNWKLWLAPTTVEFNILCWYFAHVSVIRIFTKG